jgi:hypothetical protein
MKIYNISSYVGKDGFATLRPSNRQIIKKVNTMDVWWDDWCSGGAKIGDCVYCGAINVCKSIIFEQLRGKFKELKSVPLRFNETEKNKDKEYYTNKMVTQRDYSFNCFL